VSDAQIAIITRDLSKVFRIYKNPLDGLWESITGKPRHLERTALEGVNLEVHRGEIVGVMGRNGAGKSTLLKVIAGTLERTTGDLQVNGRITAILELGTGFHPEYTGRENIYMGGLCLGMSHKEVDSKLDSIIEFSELHTVIDDPFKTYSTGMRARLTFSVAISVEPDILIVDEALSVGDARFQQKCFSRLQRLRARSATVLLVSHDTNAITSFCDRALILEDGRVYAEGEPKKISMAYHNLLFGQKSSKTKDANASTPPARKAPVNQEQSLPHDVVAKTHITKSDEATGAEGLFGGNQDGESMRYGSGEARLVEWGLLDQHGDRCGVVESGNFCRLYMVLDCQQAIDDLSCGFAIKDRRGTVLWGITNLAQDKTAFKAQSGSRLIVSAECVMWLAAGYYFVTLGAAHVEEGRKIDFVEDAIEFKVVGPDGIFTNSVVNLQTTFNIECRNEATEEATGA